MKRSIFNYFLLAFVAVSLVACANEDNDIDTKVNKDIDPKLEQFTADQIDNMTATDLLEVELEQELVQRTVTLTDNNGVELKLIVASENEGSIAAYLSNKELGLNGKAQNIDLAAYNLPTRGFERDAKVYVEFVQDEADLSKEMVLSVQTKPLASGQRGYDELDIYTSGTFIEGFDFTNLFFGPPAAVTRMLVEHYWKKNRFSSYKLHAKRTVESGDSWFSCKDGRRTRAYIYHNSGNNDLYFFQFNNCS